jgi:hypothetical protein
MNKNDLPKEQDEKNKEIKTKPRTEAKINQKAKESRAETRQEARLANRASPRQPTPRGQTNRR